MRRRRVVSGSGDRGLIQSSVENWVRIQSVIREEAVPEDVRVDCLDVIRVNGILLLKKRERARGRLKSKSCLLYTSDAADE